MIQRPRLIKKRVFKQFSKKKYQEELASEDWNEVMETHNIDVAVETFQSKLLAILDKLCPIKTIQVKKNYTPWRTKEIEELLLREKNYQMMQN